MATVLEFILNENRLDNFFLAMVFFCPFIGILVSLIFSKLLQTRTVKLLTGLLFGLAGSYLCGLWFLYNTIMNHFGLDSVAGLLINLVIFVASGALLSILFGHVLKSRMNNPDSSDTN